MRRRIRRYALTLLLTALTVGVGLAIGAGEEATLDTGAVDGPALPDGARSARVVRVVDGDTVELEGAGKARLIGVDTPEVYGGAECFGSEASDFAARELDGRVVRFTVGRGERDRYGRLLVYLWLEDGRSFNALLVARGYAQPLTVPPNDDFAETFVRLGRRARERQRGLWGRSGCAEV